MAFTFTPLSIPDVVRIISTRHGDDRGFFTENYRQSAFDVLGARFVQDNLAQSSLGVLRGLHFQSEPHAQGKLITVLSGDIYDVAVDLRLESKTFGHWVGVQLSGSETAQLWIPPGFAHGYQVISDRALVAYKVTKEYAPDSDGGIAWNDPDLAIDWPIESPVLSDRDTELASFAAFREAAVSRVSS